MLVAAAVCPCPPLIVPEVAAGAAPELDDVRSACTRALGELAQTRPDRLVIVGPTNGNGSASYPQGAQGSFRGFGVDVDVRLGPPPHQQRTYAQADPTTAPDATSAQPGLPPSLAVGAWLLAHAGRPAAPVTGLAVGEQMDSGQCVAIGAELAAGPERLALLVVGDASACRSLKAPGYFDERAADFDAAVAAALATADVPALESVDAALASELQAAGRPAWQVLAGAAKEAGLHGTLLHDDAPYGVGYLVAAWT